MDPMTMGIILGGVQMVGSAVQGQSAKELAERNVRPHYDGTTDYEEILGMFKQQATYGMDKNALTFANDVNQNAFASSVQAILAAGGDPNLITSVAGKFTDATESLAIADSERRWQKVNAVATAADMLAKGKRDEFLYNEDAPYKDTAQLAAEKGKNAYQQGMMGLDFFGQGVMNQQGGQYDAPAGKPANNASGKGSTGGMSPQMLQQLLLMMG